MTHFQNTQKSMAQFLIFFSILVMFSLLVEIKIRSRGPPHLRVVAHRLRTTGLDGVRTAQHVIAAVNTSLADNVLSLVAVAHVEGAISLLIRDATDMIV